MEEHKKEMPELEQIDLFQLLQEFWKGFRIFFWVPLVLAVLLGGGLSLRAYLNYTPRYASEATFTIETMSDTLSDIAGTSNYYDKATAEQLAKAFPYLIQSDLMRSMLQQEMGVAWLGGSITAEAVPNTNIFSIQVTSTDPQEAYDILNTVIEIYPRLADYVIGTTEMNMLTPPSLAVRIAQLVQAFGLPRSIPCTGEEYAAAIGLDKKGAGESITLILLDRTGHAMPYPMKKQQLLDLL